MKLSVYLLLILLLTSCGKPNAALVGEIIKSKGNLFIASHEDDDLTFLYNYKLNVKNAQLKKVHEGSIIQTLSPKGMDHSVQRNELYIANKDYIQIFSLDSDSNIESEIGRIYGVEAKFTDISDVKYLDERLFVLDSSLNAILVFKVDEFLNPTPIRMIKGAKTLLDGPKALAIFNDEVYVANKNSNSIAIFDINANGDKSPIRYIQGSLTAIDSPSGIAINPEDQIIFISNFNDTILKFDLFTNADSAPMESLSGQDTLLKNPGHLIFDEVAKTIIVCNKLNQSILTFPHWAIRNSTPSFVQSGIKSPTAITLIRKDNN